MVHGTFNMLDTFVNSLKIILSVVESSLIRYVIYNLLNDKPNWLFGPPLYRIYVAEFNLSPLTIS